MSLGRVRDPQHSDLPPPGVEDRGQDRSPELHERPDRARCSGDHPEDVQRRKLGKHLEVLGLEIVVGGKRDLRHLLASSRWLDPTAYDSARAANSRELT
jgi:hypothetical protein